MLCGTVHFHPLGKPPVCPDPASQRAAAALPQLRWGFEKVLAAQMEGIHTNIEQPDLQVCRILRTLPAFSARSACSQRSERS
jgi:hypothetical protein